jgi:hypothetical protein
MLHPLGALTNAGSASQPSDRIPVREFPPDSVIEEHTHQIADLGLGSRSKRFGISLSRLSALQLWCFRSSGMSCSNHSSTIGVLMAANSSLPHLGSIQLLR